MALTSDQIKQQSQNAYAQWKDKWRKHAEINSKYEMKTLEEFENSGVGMACLAVGNGYSLEAEIETIKKYKGNVDIIACDKSLGALLDNGIVPKFCMVCDASIDTARYLEPYKDKIKDIILFSNVCANPEWSGYEWKDRFFFVVEDVLGSQEEFSRISGCKNVIPAGTNVGNSLVIMLSQSNNKGRRNFFGYDKILLIGFDFCWKREGSYYAFNKAGDGKSNYMRHIWARNLRGDLVWTSNNLAFSAQWLQQYINSFKLPVVQCSKDSVLSIKNVAALESQMKYSFKREDAKTVIETARKLREVIDLRKKIEAELTVIGMSHYRQFLATT